MTDRGSSDTPSSVRQIAAELAVDFDTPVGTIEELVAGSFDELSDGRGAVTSSGCPLARSTLSG